MAVDLASLWNFADPAASERAFAAALAGARGDDALILRTQIARTYGLRADFARAALILEELAAPVAAAGPLARAHHALESGRAILSATHPPSVITPESRAAAKAHYLRAVDLAAAAGADALRVDALHMLALTEPAPERQLDWTTQALAAALASDQPAARRWRPALHNNIGCALHAAGRLPEALEHFTAAAALRAENPQQPREHRIARWMVAWTLRGLGRLQEALDLQLRLEAECHAAGEPDPYVFEELATLHAALNNPAQAAAYAAKHQAATAPAAAAASLA